MSVKLTAAQWKQVLGRHTPAADAEAEAEAQAQSALVDGEEGVGALTPTDLVRHARVTRLGPRPQANAILLDPNVVIALFLEADDPDPTWGLFERAIDSVVQALQPSPVMTHVELIIPGAANQDVHFATYLGRDGRWGDSESFKGGRLFYLDKRYNGRSWRAVPIVCPNAVERMRTECDMHETTPYGSIYRLYQYPFSAPPLRTLAWTLANERRDPAHCACLTARCLSMGLPELNLSRPAPWYGPSTLFLELTSKAQTRKFLSHFTPRAEPDPAAIDAAIETLVYGSDDDLVALAEGQIGAAIHRLTDAALHAGNGDDGLATQKAQHKLSRALLRWSVVYRPAHRA